jgi:hypothetical protein
VTLFNRVGVQRWPAVRLGLSDHKRKAVKTLVFTVNRIAKFTWARGPRRARQALASVEVREQAKGLEERLGRRRTVRHRGRNVA